MHLLSTSQIRDHFHLENFFKVVDIMCSPWQFKVDPIYQARGKVMIIMKDEASTRTRVSFEVAMKRLGGEVVNLPLDNTSSAAKGETLEDMVRTVSEYADVIVLRHSQKGAVESVARVAKVPLINAGDGDGEHPTQALLDCYTIRKELGGVDDLKIMLVGDLRYSRTIHSLVYLLSLFQGVSLSFVCPEGLEMPQHYYDFLKERKVEYQTFGNLKKAAGAGADVVYMTRLQKERIKTTCVRHEMMLEGEFASFHLTEAIMDILPQNCRILSPLPRCGEIPVALDNDPRSAYWRQAKNGMYVRMALLYNLFDKGVLI